RAVVAVSSLLQAWSARGPVVRGRRESRDGPGIRVAGDHERTTAATARMEVAALLGAAGRSAEAARALTEADVLGELCAVALRRGELLLGAGVGQSIAPLRRGEALLEQDDPLLTGTQIAVQRGVYLRRAVQAAELANLRLGDL